MDEFLEDLKSGKIQFRDRWQFELKFDFSLLAAKQDSTCTQEFYFFIPNSLQVTPQTYSKEDFYKDLTNIIRYKTPILPLNELCFGLKQLFQKEKPLLSEIQLELKLLGNEFKSSLRKEIHHILVFSHPPELEVRTLCAEIKKFREEFKKIIIEYDFFKNSDLKITSGYLDEYIGNSIDYYLTGLLDQFQMHHNPVPSEIEKNLCNLIVEENEHRKATHHGTITFANVENTSHDEHILYRIGLLNKYFQDALQLRTDRISVQEKYGTWISDFSTAAATCVYVFLLFWQGQWFLLKSIPFLLITVAAYVLKDRLKDWLKSLSYRRALSYFSDFRTKILSPSEEEIGELKESFTFVDENQIPEEIRKIRNFEFHAMLKTFKRPEQVFYFKRIIKTHSPAKPNKFKALNVSVRYNLQDFLEKASDPYHAYATLDPATKTILKLRLPKVYHLNVILRNQFLDADEKPVIELHKFRIIINKNGIKNIEQIQT